MNWLRVHDWDQWQSYRKDRGQPPWIKVHRTLMRDVKWASLSSHERGDLVSIWLLAADNDGRIPADSKIVQKFCYMDEEPNLKKFMDLGLLEPDRRQGDAKVTPGRRQHDAPETETEAETEERRKDSCAAPSDEGHAPAVIAIPTNRNGHEYPVQQEQVDEWEELYPAVDVMQELRKMRGWALANQAKRKTHRGMPRFIAAWMAKEQDKGGNGARGRDSPAHYPSAADFARRAQELEEQGQ